VRIACQLILGSLVFGLLTLVPAIHGVRPDEAPTPIEGMLLSIVVFGGLTVWLALLTYRGLNWARWALLAYLILGWWMGAEDMTQDFIHSPLAGMINLACMGMEVVAAGLLFVGRGARWFVRVPIKASP
jgi:hypothetical protein